MAEEQKQEVKSETKRIAVIRIRGSLKLKTEMKDTMTKLRLFRQNYCVILQATPSIIGMVKKVASYVTWGEIDDETLKLLKEKREEKSKDNEGKETIKKFFRLSPPRKGFERKGIKIPFALGGALGYRGEKINNLLKRMI